MRVVPVILSGGVAILFYPKTYRYKSRRPGQAALEQRIKEICQTRLLFGCRRVHVLLQRKGWQINQENTYRVQGVGHSIAQQDAEAARKGEAQRLSAGAGRHQ